MPGLEGEWYYRIPAVGDPQYQGTLTISQVIGNTFQGQIQIDDKWHPLDCAMISGGLILFRRQDVLNYVSMHFMFIGIIEQNFESMSGNVIIPIAKTSPIEEETGQEATWTASHRPSPTEDSDRGSRPRGGI